MTLENSSYYCTVLRVSLQPQTSSTSCVSNSVPCQGNKSQFCFALQAVSFHSFLLIVITTHVVHRQVIPTWAPFWWRTTTPEGVTAPASWQGAFTVISKLFWMEVHDHTRCTLTTSANYSGRRSKVKPDVPLQ